MGFFDDVAKYGDAYTTSLMRGLGFLPPEYADPTTEAFKRRQQAYAEAMQLPETQEAMRRAQEETFGALGGARTVGTQQAALAEALRAQAEGRTPSLAAKQYEQALQQSQAAIQSQLASARGLSPEQAQSIAAQQQAAMSASGAAQSAQLRLQEQMAAQAALGNLLGQQRQQELLGGQLAAGLYGSAGGLGTEGSRLRFGAAQFSAGTQAAQEQAGRQKPVEIAEDITKSVVSGATKAASMGMGGGGTPATKARGGMMAAKGAEVPGRAKFSGDTRSNDTVPAMLSPGEIVLPRTVAQSDNAPEKAKMFVEAIKGKKKPSPRDYMQALMRLQELESRMDAMEALADLEAEHEG